AQAAEADRRRPVRLSGRLRPEQHGGIRRARRPSVHDGRQPGQLGGQPLPERPRLRARREPGRARAGDLLQLRRAAPALAGLVLALRDTLGPAAAFRRLTLAAADRIAAAETLL